MAARALLLLLISPSLVAAAYFGLLATPIHVSQAAFVLRSSSNASLGGGLSGLLRMVGVASTEDETYAVHEYMTSRDALAELSKSLDLRAIYGRPDADWLARYPNPFYGPSEEDFARYMKGRISVSLNPTTGISLLEVKAFTPEDAQAIATRLLELGEVTVNALNARIQRDAIRVAEDEVTRAKERLQDAQVALTVFRNRELTMDPNESSLLVTELVARLSEELARIETQLSEALATSPGGPQVVTLQRRSSALREQIAAQRARFTEGSEGLARKVEDYERLKLEQDVATKVLSSAILSLEQARSEARRKQQYLERVAAPQLSDEAAEPDRLFDVTSIAALNLVALLLGWLMFTGISEHRPGRKVFAA